MPKGKLLAARSHHATDEVISKLPGQSHKCPQFGNVNHMQPGKRAHAGQMQPGKIPNVQQVIPNASTLLGNASHELLTCSRPCMKSLSEHSGPSQMSCQTLHANHRIEVGVTGTNERQGLHMSKCKIDSNRASMTITDLPLPRSVAGCCSTCLTA